MHNLFFVRRRFGKKSNGTILTLFVLSLVLLALGIGLVLLNSAV